MVTALAAMRRGHAGGQFDRSFRQFSDMMLNSFTLLGHDAQDFAALPARARLLVGHHALGRRRRSPCPCRPGSSAARPCHRDAQPGRLTRSRRSMTAGPRNTSGQSSGAACPHRHRDESRDVALILEHLDDGRLQARGGELHLRGLPAVWPLPRMRVEQVSNGIGHAHAAFLTSSSLRQSRNIPRGSRLRGSSPASPELAVHARANAR